MHHKKIACQAVWALSPSRFLGHLIATGWIVLLPSANALAQTQLSQLVESEETDRVTAATVNGDPIRVGEIRRELAKVLRDRKVEQGALQLLQAQTLRQLVSRRLILVYLQRKDLGANEQDINLGLLRVERKLKQQNLTLAQYLKSTGIDRSDLRRALAWQIGWKNYLDRYLTDENLKRHFDKHHRDFDGSQLHVAHILLEVDPPDNAVEMERVVANAKRIRAEIASGKITFDVAAQMFSVAPTANAGGDIGLIERHQPMGEAFSVAAFALDKGEVSSPIVTSFGIHLIRCVEIKPGNKTWQDVRGPLRIALTRYLFDWVADQQRASSTIKYTGAMPHFVLGANVLAE